MRAVETETFIFYESSTKAAGCAGEASCRHFGGLQEVPIQK